MACLVPSKSSKNHRFLLLATLHIITSVVTRTDKHEDMANHNNSGVESTMQEGRQTGWLLVFIYHRVGAVCYIPKDSHVLCTLMNKEMGVQGIHISTSK